MADPSTCLPLTPDSIRQTHARIKPHIHYTPLLTSRTLNAIASHPNPRSFLSADPPSPWDPPPTPLDSDTNPPPKLNLYFKMESTQRIGAFKVRGAFSALTHLASEPSTSTSTSPSTPGSGSGIGITTLRTRGVTTHSSGNHAQALALAASSLSVPATIVMPTISTPSKISGTRNTPGVTVVFSGSTGREREDVVKGVIKRGGGVDKGPILVPPYDHVDIVLGQGTVGLEMEGQFVGMKREEGVGKGTKACSFAVGGGGDGGDVNGGQLDGLNGESDGATTPRFDAVITPLGGGGLLSGVATWFSHTHTHIDESSPSSTSTITTSATPHPKKTLIFGSEPSHQGANDAQLSLSSDPPVRIPHVSSLTIADGLRTPLGVLPWSVISNKELVEGVYSVSEVEIKMALKLVMERMKVFVEPSGVVGLAVVLFDGGFRRLVAERQRAETEKEKDGGEGRAWDVGVVVSGGNMTVEGVAGLFGQGWMDQEGEEGKEGVEREGKKGEEEFEREREVGAIGKDGEKVAEDVAG